MAVSCWVIPRGMEGSAGAMARETSAAGPTASVVEPLVVLDAAVMVDVPLVKLVASPWLPEVLLTVATAVLEELQVAAVVKFLVDPSL